MKQVRPLSLQCPAARALESVGDRWSILIIRDAFQGLTRFDDFQKSLGIAPNILTRRLQHLESQGLFERRRYSDRPVRYEYVLTARGRAFFPVLMTLFYWGSSQFGEDEVAMQLADLASGFERQVAAVDAATGEVLSPENTTLIPGPAASDAVRERIAHMRAWYLGIDA